MCASRKRFRLSPSSGGGTSDHHGLHDEYLCGFNRPRRDVQGLHLRLVGRLHERANRPWIAPKQSRCLAPECRDGAGLGEEEPVLIARLFALALFKEWSQTG
jgi:hypothetical protein